MVTALLGAHDLAGRHLHEPPPRARSTSGSPATASRSATTRWRRCSPTWPAIEPLLDVQPSLLRAPHGGRVPLVLRRGGRRRRRRGRAARALGRHQRRRRRRRGAHQRRPRPHRRPGRLAAAHRRGEGGIVKEGATFVLGETDPDAGRRVRRHAGGRGVAARRRLRLRRRTRSPSAVGCSTCARPARRYEEVFLPLHGAAPGRERRRRAGRRRGVLRPAARPRPRGRRASPPCATPGRFEVVQHDPLADPRRRPQPRRRHRGGRDARRGVHRHRRHRTS